MAGNERTKEGERRADLEGSWLRARLWFRSRWWSVFWELFTATGGPEQPRNNVVPHSMDAALYVQVSFSSTFARTSSSRLTNVSASLISSSLSFAP